MNGQYFFLSHVTLIKNVTAKDKYNFQQVKCFKNGETRNMR
jgi:hypothetical protein